MNELRQQPLTKYWIYGLTRPNDPDDICYVGVSTNPKRRLHAHRSIKREKFNLVILDNFECAEWQSALQIEKYWITLVEKRNNVLLNSKREMVWHEHLCESELLQRIEQLKHKIKQPTYSWVVDMWESLIR